MTLSPESVRDLLERLRQRGGDCTDIEVKLGAGGVPRLGHTLCAFGNMPTGGTIIVGLDEANDFEPVGVLNPADMAAGLAAQARQAVVPPVQVQFDEAEVDGVVIVVATVAPLPLSSRPCRYQGNAYLRQADGDYVMSDQEVQQILAQRDRPRHDAAIVPETTKRDLNKELTEAFIAAARSSNRLLSGVDDDEVLRRTRVLSTHGAELTVAGLYALGAYPQQFAPSLSITAAVQLDPRTGSRTRDLAHLVGPIPTLLEDAMSWVVRNTRSTIRYSPDGHARDHDEIPTVAVRELVANALVHRDLSPHSQSKRVELRLTDDHLVITNPGGLWGINQAQLGTPAGKSAVNEFLYDICKLTRTSQGDRVIEGEGGGIRDAKRVMSAANLRPPTFIDKGVSFTVLVPRLSLLSLQDLAWLDREDPDGRLNEVQRRLAVAMRHGRAWTNASVREEFSPMDSVDARAALQGLVGSGVAVVDGERGQTVYRLADALDLAAGSDTPPQVRVRHLDDDPAGVGQESLFEPRNGGASPRDGHGPSEEVTAHGMSVWHALGAGHLGVAELAVRTSLKLHQVRYALKRLLETGWVDVDGGWGDRRTTYRRKAVR